ncbi:MAG: DUF2202 domain-containing protein [Planctomycetales bacterium]|nr:DUF2202 domain-containing protein [Planctomycetales bacterium]
MPHPPIGQVISSISKSDLSEQERAGLLLMREEEKLAHDVYVKLSEKWPLRPLQNIPRGEQMHMDAMKALLDRYGIQDPIDEKPLGEFSTADMQKLYDQLVAQGEQSIADAVEVGLLIEELDIADLNRLMQQADNEDIKVVYQNLTKGSRNHLRMFWRQLGRYNGSYTPQHLAQSEFDRIARSEPERGQLITDPNFQF